MLGQFYIKKMLSDNAIDLALISDASGAFEISTYKKYTGALGTVKTSVRSTDIMINRIANLERETTTENCLSFPIAHELPAEEHPANMSLASQRSLKFIRTDLDKFNPAEINALVTHGYGVAKQIIEKKSKEQNCILDIQSTPNLQSQSKFIHSVKSKFEENIDDSNLQKILHQAARIKPRIFSSSDMIGNLLVVFLLTVVLSIPTLWVAFNKDNVTLKSIPFTMELKYPGSLAGDFQNCFEIFPVAAEDVCEVLAASSDPEKRIQNQNSELDLDLNREESVPGPIVQMINSFKTFYAVNDKVNDIALDARNISDNDIIADAKSYCNFRQTSTEVTGKGKGYIWLEGKSIFKNYLSKANDIAKSIFQIQTSTASVEQYEDIQGEAKNPRASIGFILFDFLKNDKPSERHGFSFVAQEGEKAEDENKLILHIAQPPNYKKQGGIWQAKFDTVTNQDEIVTKLKSGESIKGSASIPFAKLSKLPPRKNARGENVCKAKFKFADITLIPNA